MEFWFGYTSQHKRIAQNLGATLANSSVGERRSLDWTVKQSVTFVVGFWTFRLYIQDQHRIVLLSKECHYSTSLKRAFLLRDYAFLVTMHTWTHHTLPSRAVHKLRTPFIICSWEFSLNVPLECWHIDGQSSEVLYQWMSAYKKMLHLSLRLQNCSITVLMLTVLPTSPFPPVMSGNMK